MNYLSFCLLTLQRYNFFSVLSIVSWQKVENCVVLLTNINSIVCEHNANLTILPF